MICPADNFHFLCRGITKTAIIYWVIMLGLLVFSSRLF
jgi:hypothetical protein